MATTNYCGTFYLQRFSVLRSKNVQCDGQDGQRAQAVAAAGDEVGADGDQVPRAKDEPGD